MSTSEFTYNWGLRNGHTIHSIERKAGVVKGLIAKALQRKAPLSVEVLGKIALAYPDYPLQEAFWCGQIIERKGNLKGNASGNLLGPNANLNANLITVNEPSPPAVGAQLPKIIYKLQPVLVNTDNEELIVDVPIAARAGYLAGHRDAEWLSTLPAFSLPGKKYQSGTWRRFPVEGDSMENILFEGMRLLSRMVQADEWQQLRESRVYVVVHEWESWVVKRISYPDKERRHITLSSDNKNYKPYDLPLEEISEVWYVDEVHSPFLPKLPDNEVLDRIKAIERKLEQLIKGKK